MDLMGTNVASVEPIRAATDAERLRVLLVAPPMVPVPPPTYAGTERVVAALGDELHARGHAVTLVGPGDSEVPYELIPTVEQSLWSSGFTGDVASYMQHTIEVAWREAHRFDIVHAHMENHSFVFAEHCETPVITTLHGRLDAPGLPELLEVHGRVPLVAISESQRRWFPDQNWVATIHHGLPLEAMPFSSEPGGYLAFVGRITPEKPDDHRLWATVGISSYGTSESPGPTSVTAWPRAWSSSPRAATTRSVPAYVGGGTGTIGGATRSTRRGSALVAARIGSTEATFVPIRSIEASPAVLASRGGRSDGLRLRDDAPARARRTSPDQPARWGGTGVGTAGASVTVTRMRAGALPSADNGPRVGEIVSRSRR